MEVHSSTSVGCLHVDGFVEDAEPVAVQDPRGVSAARSEVVLARLVGEYHDEWVAGEGLQRFQAILKRDDQVVVVYGHGLKPVVVGNDACLGVWRRSEGQEVFVALFPVNDTVGVFTGNVQVAQ